MLVDDKLSRKYSKNNVVVYEAFIPKRMRAFLHNLLNEVPSFSERAFSGVGEFSEDFYYFF